MLDFDDFDDFFRDGKQRERATIERDTVQKNKARRPDVQDLVKQNDLDEVMETLLKRSKKFTIGNREYTFDNNE